MSDADPTSPNKADLLAKAARSTVGVVPFVGPLLSELVTSLIPNQRVERLSNYVSELERRLLAYEEEKIRKKLNDEEYLALVEDSFIQASRATTDARREYIASIVENGLTREMIEGLEARYLLNILNELNDVEIILLRSYLDLTIGGDEGFREQHENILDRVFVTLGSTKEEAEKGALQDSYHEHLERLGLIKPHYRMDRDTNIPEFDTFSGKPRVTYWTLTTLGQMLLENIGLVDSDKG